MPLPAPHHGCRIPGCSVLVGAEQLLCNRHWFMLPWSKRQALQRAARLARSSGDLEDEAARAQLADLAVEHVVELLDAAGSPRDAAVSP